MVKKYGITDFPEHEDGCWYFPTCEKCVFPLCVISSNARNKRKIIAESMLKAGYSKSRIRYMLRMRKYLFDKKWDEWGLSDKLSTAGSK